MVDVSPAEAYVAHGCDRSGDISHGFEDDDGHGDDNDDGTGHNANVEGNDVGTWEKEQDIMIMMMMVMAITRMIALAIIVMTKTMM